MPTRYTTLTGALNHLAIIKKSRMLWSVLQLGDTSFFPFWSSQTEGQISFEMGKTVLEYLGAYGGGAAQRAEALDLAGRFFDSKDEMPGLKMAPAVVAGAIGDLYFKPSFTEPVGGHAEEDLCRNFAGLYEAYGNGTKDVTIINSDSPCTTFDKTPSDNMLGWPPSCTAKLIRLCQDYAAQGVTFNVLYLRKYGYFGDASRGGDTGIADNFAEVIRGQNVGAGGLRISIRPIEGELKAVLLKEYAGL